MKSLNYILISILGFFTQQFFMMLGLILSFIISLKKLYPEGFSISFSASKGFIINNDNYLISDIISNFSFFPFFVSSIISIFILLLFYKKEYHFLNFEIKINQKTFFYSFTFFALYTSIYFFYKAMPETFDCNFCDLISNTFQTKILAIIAIGIAFPFLEELVFRGFLYNGLKQIKGDWFAIFMVTFIFVLVHGQYNIYILITMIPTSFFLTYVRYKTGNIWLSFLFHAVNNTLSIVVN